MPRSSRRRCGFFSLLTQLKYTHHYLYQSVPEPSRDLPHGGGQPGDARGGMRIVGDAEAEPAVCAAFPRKEGAIILADGEAVPMAARCGPPAKLCRARASVAFATPSPTSGGCTVSVTARKRRQSAAVNVRLMSPRQVFRRPVRAHRLQPPPCRRHSCNSSSVLAPAWPTS